MLATLISSKKRDTFIDRVEVVNVFGVIRNERTKVAVKNITTLIGRGLSSSIRKNKILTGSTLSTSVIKVGWLDLLSAMAIGEGNFHSIRQTIDATVDIERVLRTFRICYVGN